MAKPFLIVVTGPTGSGKTALALDLAERVGGEIVSADSMQVYRHLDVGTAKPSARERARVPHHLVDIADPDEPYHAGRFREEAGKAISDICSRGRVPVVAGGTALYIKALTEGLAPAPGRDDAIRADLEAQWDGGGRSALWEELRRADPKLAGRLHPNDRTRIVRGLEVWRATGRTLSSCQAQHRFRDRPYRELRLGLEVPRPVLYARIDLRARAMMEAGWVEEVRRVLSLGYSPHVPALRAIGYRQIVACLLRGEDPVGALPEIQRETRQFAKRQVTWFRAMGLVPVGSGELNGCVERVRKFLQTPAAPL